MSRTLAPTAGSVGAAGSRWARCSTGRAAWRALAVMRIALGPITLLHLRPFLA